MAREFQPSTKSLSPSEQATARLRYICKAATVVETHVAGKEELPPWVLDRLNQAAQLMGMAVSYVSFAEEKKFKSGEEKREKEKKPKTKTKKTQE